MTTIITTLTPPISSTSSQNYHTCLVHVWWYHKNEKEISMDTTDTTTTTTLSSKQWLRLLLLRGCQSTTCFTLLNNNHKQSFFVRSNCPDHHHHHEQQQEVNPKRTTTTTTTTTNKKPTTTTIIKSNKMLQPKCWFRTTTTTTATTMNRRRRYNNNTNNNNNKKKMMMMKKKKYQQQKLVHLVCYLSIVFYYLCLLQIKNSNNPITFIHCFVVVHNNNNKVSRRRPTTKISTRLRRNHNNGFIKPPTPPPPPFTRHTLFHSSGGEEEPIDVSKFVFSFFIENNHNNNSSCNSNSNSSCSSNNISNCYWIDEQKEHEQPSDNPMNHTTTLFCSSNEQQQQQQQQQQQTLANITTTATTTTTIRINQLNQSQQQPEQQQQQQQQPFRNVVYNENENAYSHLLNTITKKKIFFVCRGGSSTSTNTGQRWGTTKNKATTSGGGGGGGGGIGTDILAPIGTAMTYWKNVIETTVSKVVVEPFQSIQPLLRNSNNPFLGLNKNTTGTTNNNNDNNEVDVDEIELLNQLRTIPVTHVTIPDTKVLPLEVIQIAAQRHLIGNPLKSSNVQDFANTIKRWYIKNGYLLHTVTGATLLSPPPSIVLPEEPTLSTTAITKTKRNKNSANKPTTFPLTTTTTTKQYKNATVEIQVQEPVVAYQPVDIIFVKEMIIDPDMDDIEDDTDMDTIDKDESIQDTSMLVDGKAQNKERTLLTLKQYKEKYQDKIRHDNYQDYGFIEKRQQRSQTKTSSSSSNSNYYIIDKSKLNITYIQTTGKTNSKKIATALQLQPGKPFQWDSNRWNHIIKSNLFRQILSATPIQVVQQNQNQKQQQQQQHHKDEKDDDAVQFQIVALEAPTRHLEYGIGKSLYTGSWEGEMDFQHLNVFGGGESFSINIRKQSPTSTSPTTRTTTTPTTGRIGKRDGPKDTAQTTTTTPDDNVNNNNEIYHGTPRGTIANWFGQSRFIRRRRSGHDMTTTTTTPTTSTSTTREKDSMDVPFIHDSSSRTNTRTSEIQTSSQSSPMMMTNNNNNNNKKNINKKQQKWTSTNTIQPSVRIKYSDGRLQSEGGYDVELFRDYIGGNSGTGSEGDVSDHLDDVNNEYDPNIDNNDIHLVDRKGITIRINNPIDTQFIRHSVASTSMERTTSTSSSIQHPGPGTGSGSSGVEYIGSTSWELGPFYKELPLDARSNFDCTITAGTRLVQQQQQQQQRHSTVVDDDDDNNNYIDTINNENGGFPGVVGRGGYSSSRSSPTLQTSTRARSVLPYSSISATTRQIFPLFVPLNTRRRRTTNTFATTTSSTNRNTKNQQRQQQQQRPIVLALRHSVIASTPNLPVHVLQAHGTMSTIRGTSSSSNNNNDHDNQDQPSEGEEDEEEGTTTNHIRTVQQPPPPPRRVSSALQGTIELRVPVHVPTFTIQRRTTTNHKDDDDDIDNDPTVTTTTPTSNTLTNRFKRMTSGYSIVRTDNTNRGRLRQPSDGSIVIFTDWVITTTPKIKTSKERKEQQIQQQSLQKGTKTNNKLFRYQSCIGIGIRKTIQGFPIQYDICYNPQYQKIKTSIGIGKDFDL